MPDARSSGRSEAAKSDLTGAGFPNSDLTERCLEIVTQHDFAAVPGFLHAWQVATVLPDFFVQARVVSVTPVVETRIAIARKSRKPRFIVFFQTKWGGKRFTPPSIPSVSSKKEALLSGKRHIGLDAPGELWVMLIAGDMGFVVNTRSMLLLASHRRDPKLRAHLGCHHAVGGDYSTHVFRQSGIGPSLLHHEIADSTTRSVRALLHHELLNLDEHLRILHDLLNDNRASGTIGHEGLRLFTGALCGLVASKEVQ